MGLLKLLIALIVAFAALCASFPQLEVSGFSWAENLAFDGLGNMWVSEAIRGELWRIWLNSEGTSYNSEIYLTKGVSQFGGLAITPCGEHLYAGVTLDDKSYALIHVPLTSKVGTFDIILNTKNQPNGLAADWENKVLYYTDEGTGSSEGGTVYGINLTSGSEFLVRDHMDGADGAWFDEETRTLYIGLLISKQVAVFDVKGSSAVFKGQYVGASKALSSLHMIDDITLFSRCASAEASCSTIAGADWTGKALHLFGADGQNFTTVPPPSGLRFNELTSVRWGKGPGFDSSSLYVSEGGGLVASQTDRRILQVKI